MKVVAEAILQRQLDEPLEEQDQDAMARVFFQRTGLYPAGKEALQIAYDEVRAEFARRYDDFFADQVHTFFDRCLDWLRQHAVEICRTEGSEFVIGDIPALTLRGGVDAAGPHQGVGLENCDTLYMPLTPKLGIAASIKERYIDLGHEAVRQLNDRQWWASSRRISPGRAASRALDRSSHGRADGLSCQPVRCQPVANGRSEQSQDMPEPVKTASRRGPQAHPRSCPPWRRWDSNPRNGRTVLRFSRPAPSAARPHLRDADCRPVGSQPISAAGTLPVVPGAARRHPDARRLRLVRSMARDC